ncbi:MAG TPA: DNA starvation/stationary phase protection protein [Rhizomicrobium sp.]
MTTPKPTLKTPPTLPCPLGANATQKIAASMNRLLADVFALYVKTKNFHWHVSGPRFRECHLAFDEQAGQVFAMVDPIAERVRKLGAPTLRSLGEIRSLQRIADSDDPELEVTGMLRALAYDNGQLASEMRGAHSLCDELGDVATASLLEGWIDETEGRLYVLSTTLAGAPD